MATKPRADQTFRTNLTNSVLKNVKSITPFSQVLNYQDYVNPNLIKQSAQQEATGYFKPLWQQATRQVSGDFGRRGLTRSNMRKYALGQQDMDFRDRQAQMIQDLYESDLGEAEKGYQLQQKIYEEDPTKYVRPNAFSPKPSYTSMLKNY